MVTPKYQRVVLKLSGEALAGDAGFGIKPPVIKEIIQEIKEVHELGVEALPHVGDVPAGAAEDRAVLHGGEEIVIDHPVRGRGERHDDDHHVRLGKEIREFRDSVDVALFVVARR